MVMCFAPDCKHYSDMKMCRFFRFPKDSVLKARWMKLIRRQDKSPTANSLICSCHFINGDRNNLPTLYAHSEQKRFQFTSPEKKKRRTTKTTEESVAQHSSHRVLFSDTEAIPSTSSAQDVMTFSKEEPEIMQHRPPSVLSSASSMLLSESCTSSSIEDRRFPQINNEDSLKLDSRSSSRLHEKFESLTLSTASAQQEAEMYFLQKENNELREKLNKIQKALTFECIQNDDKLINVYTGIPNRYLFDALYGLFENLNFSYYLGWPVGIIKKRDQLLLTLMKLRLNLKYLDLACRFNCSVTTVRNVVLTWIHALHEVLVCQLMENIPSGKKNKSCMPSCFSTFTNCRIVLDCTEVKCTKPKNLHKQKLTYSSYKHQNTLKGLVGVAPNGVLSFISELYPGSTSDKKIVEDSLVLNKMIPGDLILADKGFLIKDLLPAGVSLNIPPFLTTPQFTPQQAFQTRTIARARIHVERTIRRIKCFSILNLIPNTLLPHATKIFQVCGALTNMQFPLISEVEDLYGNTDE